MYTINTYLMVLFTSFSSMNLNPNIHWTCAVYITVTSIKDRLANILQDNTIYLSPDEAIPEGKERELLLKLIKG